MNDHSRLPAMLAYLPVIGWLYVYFFQRKNRLAFFHLRQAIGLVLFLVAAVIVWAVVAWVMAFIPAIIQQVLRPFAGEDAPLLVTILDIFLGLGQVTGVVGISLFTIVIGAYIFGMIAWVMGIRYAAIGEATTLPIFGQRASRLPINN
jgi:uncharacterized membrane protein